jgi:hypothetical protein
MNKDLIILIHDVASLVYLHKLLFHTLFKVLNFIFEILNLEFVSLSHIIHLSLCVHTIGCTWFNRVWSEQRSSVGCSHFYYIYIF